MTQQKNYPVSRCQAITNLIDSVAKEQDALADILEKAKKRPSYGKESESYTDYSDDYDHRSDKNKKEDEQVKLVNAVTRLEFILAYKLSLFIDCACPKDGCKDHGKHD